MAAPAVKPNIDTCHACGKFFPRVYVALCTSCAGVEENRFQLVREYLLSYQGSSINQVAEGTGLSRGEVARFYAEGRLVEVDPGWGGEQAFCTCAIEGRRCGFCRSKLARQLGEASRAPSPRPAASSGGATGGASTPPRPGGRPAGGAWTGGASGGGKKRAAQESDDGRVHYVRRVRREGDGG